MAADRAADLAADLYVALGRLVRSLRTAAPDSEVGPGGVSALATLVRNGPVRVGALAEAEGVAAASMTRIVNALETAGLVERRPDPVDARASLVVATQRGARLLGSGQEARLDALRSRISALDDADRARLEAALAAIEQLGGVVVAGR